jgi:hypothetical protein
MKTLLMDKLYPIYKQNKCLQPTKDTIDFILAFASCFDVKTSKSNFSFVGILN